MPGWWRSGRIQLVAVLITQKRQNDLKLIYNFNLQLNFAPITQSCVDCKVESCQLTMFSAFCLGLREASHDDKLLLALNSHFSPSNCFVIEARLVGALGLVKFSPSTWAVKNFPRNCFPRDYTLRWVFLSLIALLWQINGDVIRRNHRETS